MTDIVAFDRQHRVLRVSGDEDRATQGHRRQALTRAISAAGDVVVDLTELVFADTSLMLDLAMLSRRLRRKGRALLLTGPQPQIQSLICAVGLDRLPGVRTEGPIGSFA